jgi:hypothetical protein
LISIINHFNQSIINQSKIKNISYDNTNNKHDTIFTGREICSYNSDFCEFLVMEFGGDTAKRVVSDYALGAIDHKTILWNITPDGMVLGGKIIGYNRQGYIRNDWRDKITVNLSSDDAMLVGWYCKEIGFNNDVTSISDFLSPDLGTGDLPYIYKETPSLFGLHFLKDIS